jgi:hypothetical protein
VTAKKNGRALPLPPKGINVNTNILTDLVIGQQWGDHPNAQSANFAPIIFMPDVGDLARILTTGPTEARHD